jgi:hypothetical protein
MAGAAAGSRVLHAQPTPIDESGEAEGIESVLPQGDERWFASLHGSRRQVFDAMSIADGAVLRFASTWGRTMREAYNLSTDDVCAFVVLRHSALGPAFNDTIWSKYKLGEYFQIQDPRTNAPTLRNVFNSSAAGDWSQPSAAVPRLVEAGAVFGVCNVATMAHSGRAARAAGLTISGQDAYREWAANLLPGCHLVSSGVLAIHRAQNAGNCTYCFGG